MAQCVTCNQIFPPSFTQPTSDYKAAKCVFCEREISSVTITDPRTGQDVTYTKQEVVDEYLKYLKEMSERPDIKKLIIDNAVDKMKNM